MVPVYKRDWEIVRIFFILAILTVGFVWGVQSLLLAPNEKLPIHVQGLSGTTPADTKPFGEAAIAGRLGLYPEVLKASSAIRDQSPLKDPAKKSSRDVSSEASTK